MVYMEKLEIVKAKILVSYFSVINTSLESLTIVATAEVRVTASWTSLPQKR